MVKRKNIKTKKISSLSFDICDLKVYEEPLKFKSFRMKMITAEKNNIIYLGSVKTIAKRIGVNESNIQDWIDQGKRIVHKHGFKVYLNIETSLIITSYHDE